MPADLPIACSLNATDLSARLEEMAAIGRAGLLDTAISDGRATLRFAADADVRERLAAVVAAEAECCAFLELRLSGSQDELTLTIGSPAGAEPIVEDLVSAFARDRSPE
jgi:hypothetical protein